MSSIRQGSGSGIVGLQMTKPLHVNEQHPLDPRITPRRRSPARTTTTTHKWRLHTRHVVTAAFGLSLLYGGLSWHYLTSTHKQSLRMASQMNRPPLPSQDGTGGDPLTPQKGSHGHPSASQCPFRAYPPHRYFSLHNPLSEQPDFLTSSTEYIYGKWPRTLPYTSPPVKICVNQTEWDTSETNVLPFADGTNPSLLSVERLRRIPALAGLVQGLSPAVQWMATVCMTNSQCAWKDTAQQKTDFRINPSDKADTIRTLVLLLDGNFDTVQQATVWLRLDHPDGWGKKIHGPAAQPRLVALDDARLFVHDSQIWVSYREGPGFGYEAQVLNPLHFEWQRQAGARPDTLQVHILASETTFFCCGRNMALMENRQDQRNLLSLTWVDPVTVIAVNTTAQPVPPPPKPRQPHKNKAAPGQQRRLSEDYVGWHRRLSTTPHKSRIHGTNAFMLFLPPPVDAFLGVAHFHRPNDRKANPYARFGHHYTHAFYTVSSTPPYRLLALSAEFVYAAASAQGNPEMIQFSSGLEWDASTNRIVLAYGINDCEAAVTTIPWAKVAEWLQPVPPSLQVVDFMRPLETTIHAVP